MFTVGGLHSIRSCWEKKKVCGRVIIDCPAYVRQEYCHAFSLGSGFSISICCYYTRPYIIGTCSNSSATIIHHHHCIYLARTYSLCYAGVDSLKGWVSRRKCNFPDDVPQCYSLTCAYPLTFAAAELYSLLPVGRGCWSLGSPASLTSGPRTCTWKAGQGDEAPGCQGFFQYGVGNREAYPCEKWPFLLYVNVVITPDDGLHVSSCRLVERSSEEAVWKN